MLSACATRCASYFVGKSVTILCMGSKFLTGYAGRGGPPSVRKPAASTRDGCRVMPANPFDVRASTEVIWSPYVDSRIIEEQTCVVDTTAAFRSRQVVIYCVMLTMWQAVADGVTSNGAMRARTDRSGCHAAKATIPQYFCVFASYVSDAFKAFLPRLAVHIVIHTPLRGRRQLQGDPLCFVPGVRDPHVNPHRLCFLDH